jgi:transaldolase/glucose-6-phosphate isomerase
MSTSAPPLDVRLPEEIAAAVSARVDEALRDDVPARMWAKDATLWAPEGTPEVANRLGWLDLPEQARDLLPELDAFREELAREGVTDVVVLGMGGSSLAPEVVRRSFRRPDGALSLHVLDSTDPGAVLALEGVLTLERTLFLVSTKSGGTIETISLFRHFHARASERMGQDAGRAFAAITDPGSSLVALAEEHGFRRTFLANRDVGGRYSALSHFGLVPAALAGAPLPTLLERAREVAEACRRGEGNPGLWLGCLWGELALRGRDKLTWVVAPPMESFGLWVEQLVAESTGKEGRGILPVAGEPLGSPDRYGADRVFAHVEAPGGGDGAAVAALAEAGHPVVALPVAGPEDLGRLFFLTEWATAVTGRVLGINPFDQPNVQSAKDATSAVLRRYKQSGSLPAVTNGGPDGLRRWVAALGPGRYGAVMGYLPPSDEFDAAEARLRALVRDGTGAAVTFGYGPRFLHSTGQLHKGGPAQGAFLQLLGEVREDVEVPGAGYSFATLRDAQAIGDLETLRSSGLPAEQVRLRGEPVRAVEALTDAIKEML